MSDNPEMTVLGESINLSVDDPNAAPTPTPDPDNGTGEWMAKYVGEGKKYKTPDDVAKAYAHMEEFVETLKHEKATIAEQLELERKTKQSVDNILAELRQPAPTPEPPVQPAGEEPSMDIEAAVTAALDKRAALEKKEKAEQEIWSKLAEEFDGKDNAKAVVMKYLSADPARKTVFDTLALTDPNGLVAILKPLGATEPDVATEEPTLNTSIPVDMGELTWAKAQQIRKADPKTYNSREFQKALHESLNRLGEARFFGA